MRLQHKFLKVVQDGFTYHGRLHDGYLFCAGGAIKIKEDAIVTEIKNEPPAVHFSPYSEKEAQTQFEIWQKLKYSNFIEEDQNADSHDDLKQWHIIE